MTEVAATMDELRAEIARGEHGEMDFEGYMQRKCEGMRGIILAIMGWPPGRITRFEFVNVEDALPGKVGIAAVFDPPPTPEEQERLQKGFALLASLAGASPPQFIAPIEE